MRTYKHVVNRKMYDENSKAFIEAAAARKKSEAELAKFFKNAVKPKTSFYIRTVRQGSFSHEDCADRVRELSSRHNREKTQPPKRRRRLTLCEIFKWRANDYVMWLLSGKPKPDTRYLVVGKDGNYIAKIRHEGTVKRKTLGTPQYYTAILKRNAWLRSLGVKLTQP